jgi:5'-deoxy-5'-methylthioadenosine phosphorylase
MLVFIGGTGFTQLPGFKTSREIAITTPYSDHAVMLACGFLGDSAQEIGFLPRHGAGHTLPPHRINYRANVFALREAGATAILAVNAVGGIHAEMGPGVIAVPDQIIDYTHGREHTFFDGRLTGIDSPDQFSATVTHVDFTDPYDQALRQLLISSANDVQVPVWPQGVYGATQGPRLESPAEIRRMQRDGCDMVGMTGMPEAGLARELSLPYACIALSVNWGAGLSNKVITVEGIRQVLASGMDSIQAVLLGAAGSYAG